MFSKLHYVYAVYQEKSFTRAAEKLFISQPSLSAAIRGVEEKIGARLFERGGALRLTEVGEAYIAAAEQMLRAEEGFRNRLGDMEGLAVGHLSVGGTNYLCSYILPRIIHAFSARYPGIRVDFEEEHSRVLQDKLDREELDVIVDSFDTLPDAWCGLPLLRERILLCVPADKEINRELSRYAVRPADIYRGAVDLATLPPLPLDTFQKESFILLKEGNDMHRRAMKIFDEAGFAPQVSFYVDQMNISYALAESGSGLCFLTDTFFRFGRLGDRVLLYNVGTGAHVRSLFAAYKKQRYCTRAMTEFINVAKEIVSPPAE